MKKKINFQSKKRKFDFIILKFIFLSIKQMIQNFLAKANEIAVLEKIELLKKKIDTENFLAAVQIKLLFIIISQ